MSDLLEVHRKALHSSTLFRELDESIIESVLHHAHPVEYTAGVHLIEKGSLPEALFIICSGRVGIYNEDVLLAELKESSIMGESLLIGSKANATTITLTESCLASIPRETFISLCHEYPQLLFNVLYISNRRLSRSNESILEEAHSREQVLKQLVEERTAELHAALDQLQATQKFRDQFLANMSHEIRTPMNAIVGLTNLLLKSPLNAMQEKYLQVIRKSGDNLLVIINDILDLSKLEAGKMELEKVPFPLHTALQNVQTILGLKADEKGLQLHCKIDPGVPEFVLGDETRITQVIMNLAGNAIKFTEKGSVTISAKVKHDRPQSMLIRFSIRDTGIGIPADKLDQIFESFGQASADTTRKFGGTGLGLTISRQLVEMHGGTLQVNSTPGQGSEFFFEIGYDIADKIAVAEIDHQSAIQDIRGKRILLVEDNEFNQMVAVDTLHDLFEDIVVDVAENGRIAIELASLTSYDLILMDIELPDIDGFEATEFIRKESSGQDSQISICAMTASVTKDRIDACMAAGMNDYLMKPFKPEELREKVIRLVLRS